MPENTKTIARHVESTEDKCQILKGDSCGINFFHKSAKQRRYSDIKLEHLQTDASDKID